MKKIGLFTTAILFTGAVFAQSNDARKNEHGVAVSTAARSETFIGKDKGEGVSSIASSNSHASVTAAKPHTSDKADERRENKEAAAAARADAKATLKSEVAAKKELVKGATNNAAQIALNANEDAANRKDAAKAKAKAETRTTLDHAEDAGASVKKARPERVHGSVRSGTKVQLSRPGVSGKIGSITRLHL